MLQALASARGAGKSAAGPGALIFLGIEVRQEARSFRVATARAGAVLVRHNRSFRPAPRSPYRLAFERRIFSCSSVQRGLARGRGEVGEGRAGIQRVAGRGAHRAAAADA